MLTPEHTNVLLKTVQIIQPLGVTWAITGSTSFCLQGMDVDVHDIDIQTDEKGAYHIGQALSPFVVTPVAFSAAKTIRSHFGRFVMDDMDIEVMGDIQKHVAGRWEDVVPLSPIIRYVCFEGVLVPVLDLRYECEAYYKMERFDKAALIQKFLDCSVYPL